MSFVFSLLRRINNEGRLSTEKPNNLAKIKDETKYILPSEKQVDFIQERLVKKGDFPLFTDVETFLLNKQKIKFLEEVIFSLPSFYFWLKPQFSLQLAVRNTVRKLSGVTDPAGIESIISQNLGIYNYFATFLRTVVGVYRYSLRKDTGLSQNLTRSILLGLVEFLFYQQPHTNGKKTVPNVTLDFLQHIAGLAPTLEADLENGEIPKRGEGNFEGHLLNNYFHCFVCKSHFSSTQDLKSHIASHSDFTCLECEVSYQFYREYANHRMTVCRSPHDKSCNYCTQQADDCTCSKHFLATIKEVHEFLSGWANHRPLYGLILSETFQYFHDSMLKNDDMPPATAMAATDSAITNLEADLWPMFEVKKGEIIAHAYSIKVFENEEIYKIIKQSGLMQYVTNLLQIEFVKIPAISLIREQCYAPHCTQPLTPNHFFAVHPRCPVSCMTSNSEIPLFLSSPILHEHVNEHAGRGWIKPEEKYQCQACDFATKDVDCFTVITKHAIEHKTHPFAPKCTKSRMSVCQDCVFSDFEEFLNHCLLFHFNSDLTFRNVILKLCRFGIVEDKISDNTGVTTPLVKTNLRPLFMFETPRRPTETKLNLDPDRIRGMTTTLSYGAPNSQGSYVDESANDYCDNDAIKDDNLNGAGFYDSLGDLDLSGKQGHKPTVTRSHDGDKTSIVCNNENHEVKPGFTTEARKAMHICKSHYCWSKGCDFSTEMDSDLLVHYQKTHSSQDKTKCILCQVEYKNKDMHYSQFHFCCISCKQWFKDNHSLKEHEVSCFVATRGEAEDRSVSVKYIGGSAHSTSLFSDKTQTETNFSQSLMKLVNAATGLSETDKIAINRDITKYASENLITKTRLRGDNIGLLKQLDLIFDEPTFPTSGKCEVGKIASIMGPIKETEIFDAKIEFSNRDSIINYEKLDTCFKRVERTILMCTLQESHAKILLQNLMSQEVVDAIAAYTKCHFLDLSYRKIMEVSQLLWCPLRLDVIEQKLMSYTKAPNENFLSFTSRCMRHLELCARRLPKEDRASYVERHCARLIKSSMSPALLKEIEKKESVYSPFTSQELLDCILQHMSKPNDNLNQYEEVFRVEQSSLRTQKDKKKPQKRSGNFFKKREENKHRVNAVQADSPKLSDASKKRLQLLGPRYQGKGLICFRCLEFNHLSTACPHHDGPMPEKLCFDFSGGKRKPCGFHDPSTCQKKKFSNIQIDGGGQRQGNPSIWARRK